MHAYMCVCVCVCIQNNETEAMTLIVSQGVHGGAKGRKGNGKMIYFNFKALGRQRQADLYKFKASLVYKVSSRKTRAVTQRNPVSKINKNSSINQ